MKNNKMKDRVNVPQMVKNLFRAKLDDRGHELVSDKPVALPVGFERPPSIHEQIRQAIRQERFNQHIAQQGLETEEEANDFDIMDDDDFDSVSPYEVMEMVEEMPVEVAKELEEGDQEPPTKKEEEEPSASHNAGDEAPSSSSEG